MEMLLTVEQAAQRLQLAPFTIREQLKRGQLRGLKRGKVWRIPESALTESTPPAPVDIASETERLWALLCDPKTHNAAILEIAAAPAPVRATLAARSEQAALAYYATPTGQVELADWRALDGEPFELAAQSGARE